MKRMVVGLAALLCVWATCAAAPARRPSLRYLGIGHGPAVGDARHRIALLTLHDTLEVIDYNLPFAQFQQLPRPQCRNDFPIGGPSISSPAEAVGAIYGGIVAW